MRIRCATEEKPRRLKAANPGTLLHTGDRFFLLESGRRTDYVVSGAVGWREGVLGATRLSFFAMNDPYEPTWPTTPLDGNDPGFAIASASELVKALGEDEAEPVARERWRYVYVVMKEVAYRDESEVSGCGVFLNEADAEEFRTEIQSRVARCWIERLPIAI